MTAFLFEGKLSTVTFSQHFGLLLPSALTMASYPDKGIILLW